MCIYVPTRKYIQNGSADSAKRVLSISKTESRGNWESRPLVPVDFRANPIGTPINLYGLY